MKKLYIFMLSFSLLLISCQVEQFEITEDLSRTEAFDELAQEDYSQDENNCETLFAKSIDGLSTCFIDDGFSRWGWTIGPLAEGAYIFDLYAGAGQCDTEKGTLVGTLNVDYNQSEGTITITFDMLEGYVLNETHLYIGNDTYPKTKKGKNTVSPGQFPYKHELDAVVTDSYTIEDVSGEIFIIAHGVVCENGEDNDNDDDNGDGDGNGDNGGGGGMPS